MRTITISFMVLLLLVVGGMSITIAGWDYDESLGPDIIDGLMPIPPHVKKQYGGTNKERVVYNIAELLVTRKDHTARIKALEQLVKKLQAQVAELKEASNEIEVVRVDDKIYMVHPDIEAGVWLVADTVDLTPVPDPNEVTE